MTPRQILERFLNAKGEESYNEAIERIEEYAREMCIEQKKNCLYSFEQNVPHELTAHDAIMRANFPKELSK
jgi:hypothetical protein